MLPNRRALESKLRSLINGTLGLFLFYFHGNYFIGSLLDFMVMTTVLNIFSAMVVILNTIGLEMYSRFCASGRAKEWIGECGM
jgi:hypothetical protein